jgi:hypothetical protein
MPRAVKNVTKIVKQLRAAGGAQMRIIGSTYPDVELGLWVHPTVLGANTLALVPGSISAFQDDINPGLKKASDTVGAAFVDVTKATGAYGSFLVARLANSWTFEAPLAALPRAMRGTFNIHVRTPRYHIICALEAKTLPKLK